MIEATQFGYVILYVLFSGLVFYWLGYSMGKKDGHKLGRLMGIRIGERRVKERTSK